MGDVEEEMVREGLRACLATSLSASFASLAPLVFFVACAGAREGSNTGRDGPSEEPPPAPREFRAAWVATVANIDWPSKPGLTTQEQQAEIITIVERAKELRLNALVLQMRTSADALYPSELEPWSEYLTGEQGKAPEPFYDPLKTWIDEAHARGIEIHAWFNPYRARHNEAKSPPSSKHISQTHPSVVKSYGGFMWMDPGEPAASRQTLDVIVDVVRRYDIDGAHIDDYFYPYPVALSAALDASPDAGAPSAAAPDAGTSTRAEQDFPDDPSWQAYVGSGGTLARADWRRRNVNDLIEQIYAGVHREKSWVKFGISPFGLGRPDRRPVGISGFSQYDKLYADVEFWLEKGWLDYLAPQLYWPMNKQAQAFETLLDYWLHENTRGRHVWPGLYTSRIDDTKRSWQPDEVLGQVTLARARQNVRGQVHFSMVSLLQNRKGIGDRLKSGPYASDAIIPASPWLDGAAPPPPRAEVRPSVERVHVLLSADPQKPIARYAVWARYGADWRFFSVPAGHPEIDLATTPVLDRIVVSAVDRVGNESRRVRLSSPWTTVAKGAP
jgi:uncharacterized lipoprotein YddW (UPF0748 family)